MRILAWIMYGLWALSLWATAAYSLERKHGQALCSAILAGLCYATARLLLGVWA